MKKESRVYERKLGIWQEIFAANLLSHFEEDVKDVTLPYAEIVYYGTHNKDGELIGPRYNHIHPTRISQYYMARVVLESLIDRGYIKKVDNRAIDGYDVHIGELKKAMTVTAKKNIEKIPLKEEEKRRVKDIKMYNGEVVVVYDNMATQRSGSVTNILLYKIYEKLCKDNDGK